jgi:hypothetical protein
MIEGDELLLKRRRGERKERLSGRRRNIVRMVDSSWIKMPPFLSNTLLVNNQYAKQRC